MHKKIQRTLIAGALATMLSSVAFTVAAADGAADEQGAQAPIPQVPVRALRPNAPDSTRNVDAFSTAKPVQVGGAASLPPVYQLNNSSLIAMRPGQNIFVPIAVNHPNRFLTPFKNPQVVSTTLSGGSKKGDCGEICIRGNVVYISTDKTFPVTAFITEKGREDIALSITMLPKQVPPPS